LTILKVNRILENAHNSRQVHVVRTETDAVTESAHRPVEERDD
jgi:hypothetical protein